MKTDIPFKKKLIIREGYKQMRNKGYHATNIADILKKIKVPQSSFYYYFKNKEDLAVAVLEYYITISIKRMEKVLYDETFTPKQRIMKLYSDSIDNLANFGGVVYGNFAANLMLEMGDKNKKISEKVLKFYDKIRELHMHCLLQAKRAGEIDKSKDIDKLTKFIIYSWEGALLRAITTKNISSLFLFREMIRDYILI